MLVASGKNKHARQFVERKLVIRLRIFFLVLVVLLCVISYEMSNRYILTGKAMFAFFSGVLIGTVFSRRKTGRVLSMRTQIRQVLKSQKIL